MTHISEDLLNAVINVWYRGRCNYIYLDYSYDLVELTSADIMVRILDNKNTGLYTIATSVTGMEANKATRLEGMMMTLCVSIYGNERRVQRRVELDRTGSGFIMDNVLVSEWMYERGNEGGVEY